MLAKAACSIVAAMMQLRWPMLLSIFKGFVYGLIVVLLLLLLGYFSSTTPDITVMKMIDNIGYQTVVLIISFGGVMNCVYYLLKNNIEKSIRKYSGVALCLSCLLGVLEMITNPRAYSSEDPLHFGFVIFAFIVLLLFIAHMILALVVDKTFNTLKFSKSLKQKIINLDKR